MARRKTTFQGVEFETDAASDEEALAAIQAAVTERPDLLGAKAFAQGLNFDQRTQTAREFTSGEEFLIGAGKTFTDVLEFVGDIFNRDELTAIELNRRANDQRTFDALDDQGFGAEDFGELAPMLVGTGATGARLAIAALKSAGKSGLAVAKIGSGIGLVGSALRTFMKVGSKKKITNEVMQQAAAQPAGRAAIKKLAETTSEKTVKALTDTISKQANRKVREAQVRIARSLRAQETPGPAVSIAETAAQRGGAQVAGTNAASQRAAQEALKSQAKEALGVAGRSAKKESAARLKRELAELVRKQNTGQ